MGSQERVWGDILGTLSGFGERTGDRNEWIFSRGLLMSPESDVSSCAKHQRELRVAVGGVSEAL